MPNGWEYGLSNEVYTGIDQTNYEAVGIPPNHHINYSRDEGEFYNSLSKELNNVDKAIEKVIEISTKQ